MTLVSSRHIVRFFDPFPAGKNRLQDGKELVNFHVARRHPITSLTE